MPNAIIVDDDAKITKVNPLEGLDIGIKPLLDLPSGYISVNMSTNGKLGVPKKIHVKNFTTEDLINLSIATKEILPESILAVLKNIIYEKDIDVTRWPEKAVIELLVKVYANFFTPMLTAVEFPWNLDDIKWLEAKAKEFEDLGKTAEASEKKNQIKALFERKFIPKIDIDIRHVNIKDLPDTIKDYIVIKKKGVEKGTPDYFEVKYLSYSRIGDKIVLQKVIDDRYSDKDRAYAKIKRLAELRDKYIEDENLEELTKLPEINEKDFLTWQQFELEKALYVTKAVQALYIEAVNGKSYASASLDEKIKLLDTPIFDSKLMSKLEKKFEELDYGIDPLIEVKNPITGEVCKRQFSFRYVDILQAIRSFDSDEYDISYDS